MSLDFIIFLFWTWNKLQWHIQTYSLFDWNLLSFAICHICYLLHWKFRCFRDMCQLNLNNWCIENIDGAQGLFMFFEIIYLYPCFTCLKILDCSQKDSIITKRTVNLWGFSQPKKLRQTRWKIQFPDGFLWFIFLFPQNALKSFQSFQQVEKLYS